MAGEIHTGVFQSGHRRGGFVVVEGRAGRDVFVPHASCGTALHGDRVRVLIERVKPGRAPEGRIERVLRRANHRIVGQVARSGKILIVRPKNRKINRLVEIHRPIPTSEVPDGAWVMVEVHAWSPHPDEPLRGRLIEVLGREGEARLPILLLVREHGLDPAFPPEIEAEAEKLKRRKISEREIARRSDFRARRVFTIDPATAKDFDDAISLVEKRPDGWRISVHIADVAHYIRPGSKIDEEAYRRATSVYPVDRVIPMLPEALSNRLCSLRPGEEKLAMAVIFTVDRGGRIADAQLRESVIHSVRRFTYDEVQGLMDEADGKMDTTHPRPVIPQPLFEDLLELRKASRALLDARMRRGALDLDMPEAEILFDENGKVRDLRRRERIESHRLIEDLMIAANEAVASALRDAGLALLYRVHEPPNPDKLHALTPALARFGISLPPEADLDPSLLQAAIEKARRHPAGPIVQRLILRSLPRARYQPRNAGHYGLASRCYGHFTSPIRRYPDLIVHRAVKAMLGSEADRQAWRETAEPALDAWGLHCSQCEERAQRTEWDAEKILILEFMRPFLGDIFEGFISGVVGKGFFVELIAYPAEGFVPIRSIENDTFDLDEGGMVWRGRATSRAYALGDRITVQIERIDVLAGEMDLNLVRKKSGAPKRSGRRKSQYNWRQHVKSKNR